jgi:hemerythrin
MQTCGAQAQRSLLFSCLHSAHVRDMSDMSNMSDGIHDHDEQFKVLVDCISHIEDAVTTRQKWSAVHFALGQLRHFASIHFAVEENLMRMHDYPGLAQHAGEHRNFMSDVDALQQMSRRADVSVKMIAYLKITLEKHVITSDRRYAAYLRQVRPKTVMRPVAPTAIRNYESGASPR